MQFNPVVKVGPIVVIEKGNGGRKAEIYNCAKVSMVI